MSNISSHTHIHTHNHLFNSSHFLIISHDDDDGSSSPSSLQTYPFCLVSRSSLTTIASAIINTTEILGMS